MKVSTTAKWTRLDIETPERYIEIKRWTTDSFYKYKESFIIQIKKYLLQAKKTGKIVEIRSVNEIPSDMKVELYQMADNYGVRLEINEGTGVTINE